MTLHAAFRPAPLERTRTAEAADLEALEMDGWLTNGLAPARDVLVATTDRLALDTWSKIVERQQPKSWARFLAPTRRRLVTAAIAVGFAVSALTPVGQGVAAAAGDAVQAVERALFPAAAQPGDRMAPASEPGTPSDEQAAP